MNRLIELVGPFHPVLVHLPIGFLLLAILFQWLSLRERYAGFIAAVRLTYFLGAISAILSCLTGLALSSGGDYDAGTLQWHQWLGITVTALSIAGYFYAARPFSLLPRAISISVLLLVIITGHFGGTLTHGAGFLTKGLSTTTNAESTSQPIADVQEAVVYTDIIQPILKDKCASCHSAIKQKGGLRLDAKEWIIKGGKDGEVFHSGNASGSALYKRLVLDPLEEKHMPPKGKPQLTEQQVNIIQWWIESGAGFDKKTKEVKQPANISAALQSLQHRQEAGRSLIPKEEVSKADPEILERMRKAGIAITPVAANTNWLQASFVSIPKPNDTVVTLLSQVGKQLIWLRLPGADLSGDGWKQISNCKALTQLNIEHSNISDATLALLANLEHLQYLNLVGTAVSVSGVQQLKNLTELSQLYLGQTGIASKNIAGLQQVFPKAKIDSGNYRLAFISADTQLLHPPKVKR